MQDRHLQIVRLLADGKRRSGEDVAAELGISRAAVWKAVQKAASRLGLVIEAERGRGYRLRRPLELLDAAAIAERIERPVRRRLAPIQVLDEVDSTNSLLLRQAREGAPSGQVCLAERQSAGRGRQGRHWVSPFGGNLYLSLLWRYALPPAALGGLSLAAGVAVVKALTAAGAQDIGLKWPNDIHWRRRKLGGLLLEVAGEAEGPSQVVVGVGINLHLEPEQAAPIEQPWVDLSEIIGAASVRRNALAAALIHQLTVTLERYAQEGLGAFIDDWRLYDAYRGEPVELVQGARRITGINAGIDDDGGLLLQRDGQLTRFSAGELSLRPMTVAMADAGRG